MASEEFKMCIRDRAGYTFVEPTDELQARITSLIYDDVKGSGELNLERYESVLRDMLDPAGPCACDTLISVSYTHLSTSIRCSRR